jgi:hypothetical protein
MEQGIETVRSRLLRAAGALRAAGLPYAVVGGSAVAAWISRVDETAVRDPGDVDILARRRDFAKIRNALENAGFTDLFPDNAEAKARAAIHIIWAGEKFTKDSAEPSPDPAGSEEIGGFALVSLKSLVRMKLTAFRDKDRMHLRDLLKVGLVDEDWMAVLPPVLALRFRRILDQPFG